MTTVMQLTTKTLCTVLYSVYGTLWRAKVNNSQQAPAGGYKFVLVAAGGGATAEVLPSFEG